MIFKVYYILLTYTTTWEYSACLLHLCVSQPISDFTNLAVECGLPIPVLHYHARQAISEKILQRRGFFLLDLRGRFSKLDSSDFVFPKDRSSRYTILEISLFEGRSVETKKQFIHLLFARLHEELLIPPQDLEITIFETPPQNWGIRGLPGDELQMFDG